jgi:hypothetical protein
MIPGVTADNGLQHVAASTVTQGVLVAAAFNIHKNWHEIGDLARAAMCKGWNLVMIQEVSKWSEENVQEVAVEADKHGWSIFWNLKS